MVRQYLEDPSITVEPDREPEPGEDSDLVEYITRHWLAWFELLRRQPTVATRYCEIVLDRHQFVGTGATSSSAAVRGTASS